MRKGLRTSTFEIFYNRKMCYDLHSHSHIHTQRQANRHTDTKQNEVQ